MFKTVLTSTPLTSEAANTYFRNIYGDSYNNDYTFVSTLRALVAPRIKEDEALNIIFKSSSYSETELSRITTERAVSSITSYVDDCGTGFISVHNFTNPSQTANYAWLELMKSSFESRHSGWNLLEKVTDFFRKTFYVLCFINPERRCVIIFADNMDVRKMHYLQCAIFAFLPWYFDPSAGVSADEMELIQSLRDKTSARYEDCIAKIAAKYDFRAAYIRKMLVGFESRYEREQIASEQRAINEIIDRINSYSNKIGELLSSKHDTEVRLLGLESKIAQDSGDSEIMEYFIRNNKVILKSVSGDSIDFVVKDYLMYYNEEIAERTINNRNSFIYKPNGDDCSHIINPDDMCALMKAIFIDQSFKIKFCAAYRFKLNGNVNALGSYSSYGSECRDSTPNTHIDRYSCLGDYERAICNLLMSHDYIGAIEQCIASCRSLNFADSPVMNEFMTRLYSKRNTVNIKCIETPDGNIFTPKEAIAWMKNQEVSNG